MESPSNALARQLASLHIPGAPLILANVYDACGASALLSSTNVKVIATSSFAIASALGKPDDDLTLEENLSAITSVCKVVKGKLPVTADLQDCYGSRLEVALTRAVELGVVGCNIEDAIPNSDSLYTVEDAVDRIRRVRKITTDLGVPDFVINARTDVLLKSQYGGMEEVISRGKLYLEAGANCVFVWGASRGVSGEEVKVLVKAFSGKLNVKLSGKSDGLSVKELAEIGVCRISVGAEIMRKAMSAIVATTSKILDGGQLFE
ncbi:hypothetical protein HK098_002650 [Nowakowskiella sp. JEL0407]|nr:hypothetical protein HK098_002650 [Nowakowskiella sp. JEL0407]